MRADVLAREADTRARAGDYAGALALREQVYAALRADGDTRAAARLAAYQIAFDHLALFGNAAVSQGWLQRGIRLAEEAGDCVEAGWVALARALHAADPGSVTTGSPRPTQPRTPSGTTTCTSTRSPTAA